MGLSCDIIFAQQWGGFFCPILLYGKIQSNGLRRGDKNMKIITVCGSLRFMKEIMEVTEKMDLQGNCMLSIVYPMKPNKEDYTDEEIAVLNKMHRERIKLADAILVVNVDNYIGSTTKREIEFAKELNKEIIYYTDLV